MITIRPFENTDPPRIVEMWLAQPAPRGVKQPIAVEHLDHYVLSKPYFDRHGLLMAEEDGRLVGCVHAGFGPNLERNDVAHDHGIISLLLVAPEHEELAMVGQLIDGAETYLRYHGAARVSVGAPPPNAPFYHGLRTSSESLGIRVDDELLASAFQSRGYRPIDKVTSYRCNLVQMRPLMDRTQRDLARNYEVRATLDHVFDNWWDTCAYEPTQYSQFELLSRVDRSVHAQLLWWDDDITGQRFGNQASLGRVECLVDEPNPDLMKFLIANALKQLKSSGMLCVLAQARATDNSLSDIYQHVGFAEQYHGVLLQKEFE